MKQSVFNQYPKYASFLSSEQPEHSTQRQKHRGRDLPNWTQAQSLSPLEPLRGPESLLIILPTSLDFHFAL